MPAARVRLGKNEPPDHRHLSEEAKMKKIALIAMAASAAIATPAAAQAVNATGTINITGSVTKKCFVNGPAAGSTFGGNVSLGELAKADGTLEASSVLEGRFNAAGASVLQAAVICTSANPEVSVTATPLALAPAPSTVDPGYDATIDYDADVTFTRVGGTTLVSDSTTTPAAATATLASRLTGTGTNVSVATSDWTASGILMSGGYAGSITIVIAPGA